LRDLIDEEGPALEPRLVVSVARAILASLDEGPFDTPPPAVISPEMVEIATTPRGEVRVRFSGAARLRAVGELMYVMLAGGPLHVKKDAPDARPRPLAKLRAFLGGGPIPPGLEVFVTELLEERFADPDSAMDSLDALRID
jgi:hypothetical protein